MGLSQGSCMKDCPPAAAAAAAEKGSSLEYIIIALVTILIGMASMMYLRIVKKIKDGSVEDVTKDLDKILSQNNPTVSGRNIPVKISDSFDVFASLQEVSKVKKPPDSNNERQVEFPIEENKH